MDNTTVEELYYDFFLRNCGKKAAEELSAHFVRLDEFTQPDAVNEYNGLKRFLSNIK